MTPDDLVPAWPGEFKTWLVLCAKCKPHERGIATGYYERTNDDTPPACYWTTRQTTDDHVRVLLDDAQDQLRNYHR